MSKFQFPDSIRSRPVYGTLASRAGASHLFVADAEGAEAVLDVAKQDLSLIHISEPTRPY